MMPDESHLGSEGADLLRGDCVFAGAKRPRRDSGRPPTPPRVEFTNPGRCSFDGKHNGFLIIFDASGRCPHAQTRLVSQVCDHPAAVGATSE